MAKMMKTAERALHKRTNKILAGATKRYKKFMRQAAKAASAAEATREKQRNPPILANADYGKPDKFWPISARASWPLCPRYSHRLPSSPHAGA